MLVLGSLAVTAPGGLVHWLVACGHDAISANRACMVQTLMESSGEETMKCHEFQLRCRRMQKY